MTNPMTMDAWNRLTAAHEKGVAAAYDVLRKGAVFRGSQPLGIEAGYARDSDELGFFIEGFRSVATALYADQGGLPICGAGGVILTEPLDRHPTPGSFIIAWDAYLDEHMIPPEQAA